LDYQAYLAYYIYYKGNKQNVGGNPLFIKYLVFLPIKLLQFTKREDALIEEAQILMVASHSLRSPLRPPLHILFLSKSEATHLTWMHKSTKINPGKQPLTNEDNNKHTITLSSHRCKNTYQVTDAN